MCGIHVCISVPTRDQPLSEYMRHQLDCRGPDFFSTAVIEHTPEPRGTRVTLTAAVLSLRGDGITHQPFVDGKSHHSSEKFHEGDTGCAMCWNGEAWRLGGEDVSGNDGQAVFMALARAACAGGRRAAVLSVLRTIEGPFAFVFYDRPGGCVYYGRDRLGRRSLLLRRGTIGDDTARALVLSSIADPAAEDDWAEVEADGIYVVDLERGKTPSGGLAGDDIVRYAWAVEEAADDTSVVLGIGRFNMATDPPAGQRPLTLASPAVRQLREQLVASLRFRVTNVPPPPSPDRERDTRVAVLFSGGLDCTVLARMTHDLLPAEQGIDLINVAFENPRVKAHLHDGTDAFEACPDRITGRKSLAELQRQCPRRAWRFVAVNVPYIEFVGHRPEIVSLMYPHNTEMDLSIASALFFAARGTDSAKTSARVLLSGLGADELFGGYGRHGIAFARRGYAGLVDELLLDVGRLGKRNLGRDDRVTARAGKEVRFPFLDERLVAWAVGQPVWDKCDFAAAGRGDAAAVEPAKRVLRLVAQSLGLADVAREKKRAIQFGARTAKMESGRTKGTTLIS